MSFCQVKVNAVKTVDISKETRVPFANKISDPSSEFDVVTNAYTAKIAGDHLVVCRIIWEIGAGYWSENQYDKVIIKVNDSEVSSQRRWHTTMYKDVDTQIVDIVTLAIDDVVTIFVEHNATNAKLVGLQSDLSIKLL